MSSLKRNLHKVKKHGYQGRRTSELFVVELKALPCAVNVSKNANKHLKQLDLSQMIDTGNTLRMFSFEEKTKQQRLAMGMIQWPPFYIYVFAHCTIVF